MKVCKHCSIELTSAVKHEGYQCKTCRNGIARYGLNRNEQTELLESQNHKCGICESDVKLFVRNNQAGVVDHCHETGEVRGILCGPCNTAIGQIEKAGKEAFFKNAEKYINKF